MEIKDQFLNKKNLVDQLNQKVNQKESSKMLIEYGESLFNFDKLQSKAYSVNLRTDILSRHQLTSTMRSKMADWIYEVISQYHCSQETYFLAIHIMDLYIDKCQEVLTDSDIHLLGMVSMFIASKFEDIRPIYLEELVNEIGYGQYPDSFYKTQ